MCDKLFIIENNDGICSFYSNLKTAKDELKKLYNNMPDFKYYGYRINIYELDDNEYIKTDYIYTYNSNIFFTNIY